MLLEISLEDRDYPDLLRHIHDPPRRLWVQGDSDLLKRPLPVAVVGARECTAYGEKSAYEISRALAGAGVTVVSGLAFGIDASAHRGALDAGKGGGGTIAVLGCGIDLMSPSQNKALKDRIVAEGVVVTEFPPGTTAAPWTFPKRNRIVSGLSRGVVVVEAGVKSGSLITSDFALQQGRDVFAVPGPITSPMSEGANRLIQNGAKLVLSAKDILDELGAGGQLALPGYLESSSESGEAGTVLRLLTEGPRHVDDLIAASGISVEKMSGVLVDLEIRGRIRALPGGLYEDAGR
jgi:DNA processing protein